MYIGAAANHCAMYGVGGAHADELKAYDTSGKGTIRFHADNALPATLVRKLVKARMAVIADKQRNAESAVAFPRITLP